MEVKNDGGQAFPVSGSEHNFRVAGMTLRDYFAAKAMHAVIDGYMSNPRRGGTFDTSKGDAEHAAKVAYKIADAMIKERGE